MDQANRRDASLPGLTVVWLTVPVRQQRQQPHRQVFQLEVLQLPKSQDVQSLSVDWP